jgi:hypothetical protein
MTTSYCFDLEGCLEESYGGRLSWIPVRDHMRVPGHPENTHSVAIDSGGVRVEVAGTAVHSGWFKKCAVPLRARFPLGTICKRLAAGDFLRVSLWPWATPAISVFRSRALVFALGDVRPYRGAPNVPPLRDPEDHSARHLLVERSSGAAPLREGDSIMLGDHTVDLWRCTEMRVPGRVVHLSVAHRDLVPRDEIVYAAGAFSLQM